VSVLGDEARALVGVEGPVRHAPEALGADALRRFVHAAMETDPIHWDAAAARERGFDGVVAPPLYPMHAFPRGPGTPDPLDALLADPDWDGIELVEDGLPSIDVPLPRLLNGGVAAEVFGLARVGDRLSAQSRYTDVSERNGSSGPMVFVVVETDYRNQDGALLLRTRTTMIAR
jgi:acyl dehydratase